MKQITLSDVTLNILSEQGKTLTFRENLAIAERLDLCCVDAIELPFVKGNKENQVVYGTIASSIKNACVKIPVGDSEESFELAVKTAKMAKCYSLQVVLPVSTALMEYGYHLKANAMQDKIATQIKKCAEITPNVELVLLDAFRAEKDFVVSVCKTAKENGAKIVTLKDDAGEAFPEDYFNLISAILDQVEINVEVYPSNALSLAAACAVKAIEAGASGLKISSTESGLSMQTIAQILRAKKFDLNLNFNLDITNAKSANISVAEVVEKGNSEVEEKISGIIESTASLKEIAKIIKDMGYELSDSDIGKVFEEFKKITSNKENIDSKELEALIASTAMQVPSTYHLVNYVVNSGNIIPATANVTLEKDGEKFTGVSTGDGPIDAAFHAIEQVIGHHYELDDFQVQAVTKGRGAVGSSVIRLRSNGKLFPGNGVSTDIIGACIRAYINALNKIVYEEE